eukprot:m.109994 g.109994  ORF g.109994 m.109994 type:complete len:86 (+) comp16966_c0_seq2:118-375(+)
MVLNPVLPYPQNIDRLEVVMFGEFHAKERADNVLERHNTDRLSLLINSKQTVQMCSRQFLDDVQHGRIECRDTHRGLLLGSIHRA